MAATRKDQHATWSTNVRAVHGLFTIEGRTLRGSYQLAAAATRSRIGTSTDEWQRPRKLRPVFPMVPDYIDGERDQFFGRELLTCTRGGRWCRWVAIGRRSGWDESHRARPRRPT